jgi:ferric-dicitrate binding protein FerR (iron transport regulator)
MTRDDLDCLEALHDGRLDEARSAAWAARLAADPGLRREVAAELRLANGLRVLAGDGPARATAAARRSLALITADRDSQRAQVVARVMTRTQRPLWRRPWLWISTAGLAAAASLALLLLPTAPTPTGHQETRQDATLAWAGARPLALGDGLDGGSLRFADGSTVELAAGGSLRLAGDARRKRIDLAHGSLRAAISPQGPGDGFAISLPQGEASVLGTRFRIDAASAASLLQVDEGRVALRAGDESASIGAGFAALAVDGRVLPLPAPWSDRRPIGRWVISGAGQEGVLAAGNPNGWLHDPTVDSGNLGARLDAETTRIATLLKRIGAQGIVVYGIEGAAAQPGAGFVGDPRRLADLAPEFEARADAIFATLRQAGLTVGLSVTPWRLVQRDGRLVQEADPATAAAELEAKVTYARQRWDCRLFYINVASPGLKPGSLPDLAVQVLAARHPQALFIVEDATPGQALAAAAQVLGTDPAPPGRACVRLPWNGPGAGDAALAQARAAGDIISVDVLADDQVAGLGVP